MKGADFATEATSNQQKEAYYRIEKFEVYSQIGEAKSNIDGQLS